MKSFFISSIFLLMSCFTFAQLGSSCGFPDWDSSRGYQANTYIEYSGSVYHNTVWSQGEQPGATGSTNWILLGICNEQLLIDNPTLAYTQCGSVGQWNSTQNNYDTNDLVAYNHGVYEAKYWVVGTEKPDESDAYNFLGICVIPIDISPAYSDGEVLIQASLTSVPLSASLVTHGFSVVESQISIKKQTDANFVDYVITPVNNVITHNWTPASYGDYDIKYYCKNSVGVTTLETRTVKIAISIPPQLSLTSPSVSTAFYQLNFSSLPVLFEVNSTQEAIQSIVFKDLTSNTSNSVNVSSSMTSYSYNWTPTIYEENKLEIVATDVLWTSQSLKFSYFIIDPSKESFLFDNLPYQLKSLERVTKVFSFDKTITSVKSRDLTLTQFSFTTTKLTVNFNNPGRTGLEIITSDGDKYYVGLRIDHVDGSVPRYPTHISIGSVSEDIPDDVNFFNEGINNTNLLLNNRMDVRYTYINGGPLIGWNTWQPDRVIKFARNSLKMGLMPVFIFYNIPDGGESYTTNLQHIQSPTYMTAYFDNLELFLNQVRDVVGDEFFGVIFEPDFLGYMQQNSEPETLATAVSATTIATNAGTLKSLVERINFEINKKRVDDNLNLEFGWQLNLWAKPNVAGIRGIIRETDNVSGPGSGDFQTQLQKIKQTSIDIFQYGKTMGIMSHGADFISIDKYGLDALGYSNASDPADPSSYTWFWNNDHWLNYFTFVKSLYEESGVHVILWQITVGHINNSTSINEYTGTNFVPLVNTSKHYEDSASPFFFGDEVDFSNDQARFDYFSQNKHQDSKLISNPNNKHVTFGNHFSELNATGVKLVLMGAGVGDSTDGIGDATYPGATLTDDHFWIQKVQDYYINHLITSTLGFESSTISDLSSDFTVLIENQQLVIKNISDSVKNTDVYLFDFTGKLLMDMPNQQIGIRETIRLSQTLLSNTFYVCILKTEGSVGALKIISK